MNGPPRPFPPPVIRPVTRFIADSDVPSPPWILATQSACVLGSDNDDESDEDDDYNATTEQ